MTIDLTLLSKPFPMDVVSWRAQNVTADGTKALALAYIDARDVMNRLDDVCGMTGWQRRYSHANGKTICDIGVKCGDEWVWKADGAGDTDIEAEKGAISDAFKRAAVNWGVGRYLYNLDAVWVPCDSYKRNDGKFAWKAWKEDPWKSVKAEQKAGFETFKQQNAKWMEVKEALIASKTEEFLQQTWQLYQPELLVFRRSDKEIFDQLEQVKNRRKQELQQDASLTAGMPQGFDDTPAFLRKGNTANA